MKGPRPVVRALVVLLAVSALLCATGCTSTRSENGVIIKEKGGMNPFNYIPGF